MCAHSKWANKVRVVSIELFWVFFIPILYTGVRGVTYTPLYGNGIKKVEIKSLETTLMLKWIYFQNCELLTDYKTSFSFKGYLLTTKLKKIEFKLGQKKKLRLN